MNAAKALKRLIWDGETNADWLNVWIKALFAADKLISRHLDRAIWRWTNER